MLDFILIEQDLPSILGLKYQVPSEGNAATPVRKDIPVTKGDILEPL